MSTTILGITGPMGCGKSTIREMITGCIPTVQLSFADTLKRMVSLMLAEMGHDSSHPYTQDGKATTIPELGCTVREMLQTIGTQWGRQCVHPDLWVIIAMHRAQSYGADRGTVVFDDVRFENEAAGIRNAGGHIIHVVDRGGVADAHESEQGISLTADDYVIENGGTLDETRAQVESLIRRVMVRVT